MHTLIYGERLCYEGPNLTQQEDSIMSQLHKRFTSDQIKELLQRYLRSEIERK